MTLKIEKFNNVSLRLVASLEKGIAKSQQLSPKEITNDYYQDPIFNHLYEAEKALKELKMQLEAVNYLLGQFKD